MCEALRIAVCEDTKSDEERLISILNESRIPTEYTIFQSGEALLEAYRPQAYDLLLMDIYMGGMTGVETVSRIREIDEEVPVAFVTTSTEFTLESYRLSVLRYIEKPYREKEIEGILKLARMEKESAPALILRRNGIETRMIYARILYLEQQTHQLNVYLQDGSVEQFREKLSELLPGLEKENFFQPHKSFAVNLAFVRDIDSELRCFVMQDGRNIPIRRESMSKARQALRTYLFSRTRGGTA